MKAHGCRELTQAAVNNAAEEGEGCNVANNAEPAA
jgi:hypothetical protein